MDRLFPSYEASGRGEARPSRQAIETERRLARGSQGHSASYTLALAIVLLAIVATVGCTAQTEPPAVEEAYAARTSVALLEDLHPTAPIVAHLEMSERVQILGRRRSFVRVRTDDGREGWAKSTELITPDVRDRIMQLREQTLAEPPQGEARALEILNVHLEPYRWSPTIYQLSADEGVQVLRHKVVDRLTEEPKEGATPPAATEQDDWYLVRLETGRAGWLLTSRVYSAIPEEVAQYAERKRIVSYFSLGEDKEDQQGDAKPTWLWTQSSARNQQHDFDLVRVFLWSRQRGAYQTIKIERGLKGYLPVLIHDEIEAERGSGPGYSVIVENKDGERIQRKYVLLRNRLVKVAEEPAPAPPASIRFVTPDEPTPPPTFMERLLSWWKGNP